MRPKHLSAKKPAEQVVKDIRRATRREKIYQTQRRCISNRAVHFSNQSTAVYVGISWISACQLGNEALGSPGRPCHARLGLGRPVCRSSYWALSENFPLCAAKADMQTGLAFCSEW